MFTKYFNLKGIIKILLNYKFNFNNKKLSLPKLKLFYEKNIIHGVIEPGFIQCVCTGRQYRI